MFLAWQHAEHWRWPTAVSPTWNIKGHIFQMSLLPKCKESPGLPDTDVISNQKGHFQRPHFAARDKSMWRRTSQPGHQSGHAVQRGHSCRLNFILICTRVEKSLRENLNPCVAAPNQRAVLLPDAWLSFPGTLQNLPKKLSGTGLQLLTGKRTKARNIYPSLQLSRPRLHVGSTRLKGCLEVKEKGGLGFNK